MAILRIEPNIVDSQGDFTFNSAVVTANVTAGNVSASGYYWANGTPFVSSSYGNTDVAAYLLINSTIAGINANVAGANAAIITANTALKNYTDYQITTANSAVVSYVNTLNTAMASNVAGANAAIVTANTAMKSYVDAQDTAITNAWTANAGSQADAIAGANAAIITANTALKNYTDYQITTANSAVVSYVNTLNTAMASNVAGANAAIVTANTAMKSYVDAQDSAITSAWTANAASQESAISGLRANIIAANAAILATTINLAGTTGTGSVVNGGTLTFAGTYGVTAAASSSTITIATPQDLRTTASPSFSALTLGNLTVGNLTVQGNTTTVASQDLSITDSIINLHTFANLAPLTTDDGRDVGIAMHYYKGADGVAFVGWANDSGYLEYYAAGTESSNVFTGTAYGTIKAGEFLSVNNTPSTSTTTGAIRVTGGVGVQGNIFAGAVYTDNYNYANGVSILSGVYSSLTAANLSIAGANAAIITANTALKSYVDTQDSAITTAWTANAGAQADAIAGANAAIVTANTALKNYTDNQITTANSAVVSYINTLNTAMASNVAGANAAIVTANTALKSYVDAQNTTITNAWTANAASQDTSINALSGNITFSVTNSGASAYLIDGVSSATIGLVRGLTYTFNVNATGHPFWIKTSSVTGTGSAYSTGVTNNGTDTGTITFTVPLSAPDTLYYICQYHGSMVGLFNITSGLATVGINITALSANINAANAAIITANTSLKNYTDNQITTANSAVVSYVDTLNTAMASNVAGANAAIITANSAMKSYVDAQDTAITTAWTANAGVQADAIALKAPIASPTFTGTVTTPTLSVNGNTSTGNILAGGYFWANGTPFASSNYGNTNVEAYLPVSTTIITINSNIAGANAAIVTANTGMKSYVDAQFTAAGGYGNTQVGAYLTVYGGNVSAANITATGNIVGGGVRATTSASAPSNPTVGDIWYSTTDSTTLRYTYDGSSSFWLDISGPAVAANAPALSTTIESYLPTSATIIAINANVTAANAAIITANSALKSYTDNQITTANSAVVSYVNTLNTAMAANVAGANAAIITANTALKNYTDYQLGLKAPTASPTFTGTVTAPIVSITGNATISGNILQQQAYYETYGNITNTGGNLTCNFNLGSVFYVTSLTANVTASFTNVNALTNTVTATTLIIDQGATAYRISNIQVNGTNQTIRWIGNVVHTGTASNTDIVSFSLIHLGSGTYRVLGQSSSYG